MRKRAQLYLGGQRIDGVRSMDLSLDDVGYQRLLDLLGANPPAEPAIDLPTAVREQIGEIVATAPDDWRGHEELPEPTSELGRYDVAYARAVRHCQHTGELEMVEWFRTWRCNDCGRLLDLRSIRGRG
jgi:hypothetical protein